MMDVYNEMEGPQRVLFNVLLIVFGIALIIGLPYIVGELIQHTIVSPKNQDKGIGIWLSGMLAIALATVVCLFARLIYECVID